MSEQASKTHLSIVMVGFLGYLTLPFLYWAWLMYELESGAFPPEADSIGIPLAGFLFLWIAGLFFAFVLGAIHIGKKLR
jgi:hypothetical protein